MWPKIRMMLKKELTPSTKQQWTLHNFGKHHKIIHSQYAIHMTERKKHVINNAISFHQNTGTTTRKIQATKHSIISRPVRTHQAPAPSQKDTIFKNVMHIQLI